MIQYTLKEIMTFGSSRKIKNLLEFPDVKKAFLRKDDGHPYEFIVCLKSKPTKRRFAEILKYIRGNFNCSDHGLKLRIGW